jgi:hypothetical protein
VALTVLAPALPVQEMVEVQRASAERRERSGSVASAAGAGAPRPAAANSGVEVQPNGGAPLLRDEKARRDWVEHELDMCCQVRAHACAPSHVPCSKHNP